MKKVGVLSLQGGFARHIQMLSQLGVKTVPIRYPEELALIDGIILPGGESTTIGMLLDRRDFLLPLKSAISNGLPVFGTCAGMILLAQRIDGYNQVHLNSMNIAVTRNAYGSQIESFEVDLKLHLSTDERTFHGIFIRAPRISEIGTQVEVLSSFSGAPVLVKEKQLLAASFHPELGTDPAIHEYFINHVL